MTFVSDVLAIQNENELVSGVLKLLTRLLQIDILFFPEHCDLVNALVTKKAHSAFSHAYISPGQYITGSFVAWAEVSSGLHHNMCPLNAMFLNDLLQVLHSKSASYFENYFL